MALHVKGPFEGGQLQHCDRFPGHPWRTGMKGNPDSGRTPDSAPSTHFFIWRKGGRRVTICQFLGCNDGLLKGIWWQRVSWECRKILTVFSSIIIISYYLDPNPDRMINDADPSGMMAWFTLPDKEWRPTEVLAEGQGNEKWIVEKSTINTSYDSS